MKILIVDDSRAMRLLIVRALRGMDLPDAAYLEAADGNAALEAIRNQCPDLVVSDFNMPGMSGMDLLRSLRANGNSVRFGFITSEASHQLLEEAQQAGALFVITKPFTPANFTQALSSVMGGLTRAPIGTEDRPSALGNGQAALPKPAHIARIFEELFRRTVSATVTPAVPLPPRNRYVMAEYRRVDNGSIAGWGLCDWPCAVRLGAALTLIPPAAATEAIATGKAHETLIENLHEVLNVMSRMFDGNGSSRICLGQVHRPGEPLSPDLAARLSKPAARVDASIDISGYGKGNLTLLSLA